MIRLLLSLTIKINKNINMIYAKKQWKWNNILTSFYINRDELLSVFNRIFLMYDAHN